jgi:hypothetical protein
MRYIYNQLGTFESETYVCEIFMIACHCLHLLFVSKFFTYLLNFGLAPKLPNNFKFFSVNMFGNKNKNK